MTPMLDTTWGQILMLVWLSPVVLAFALMAVMLWRLALVKKRAIARGPSRAFMRKTLHDIEDAPDIETASRMAARAREALR